MKLVLVMLCGALSALAAVSAMAEPMEVSSDDYRPDFSEYRKKGLLMPSPVNPERLKGRPRLMAVRKAALPTRWDSREKGWVSPVKDQGNYGTCWAHATMACLETTGIIQESVTNDYSENHMAAQRVGFELGFNDGANYSVATALLVSWRDPLDEKDDLYPNPGSTVSLPAVRHVQETRNLPLRTDPTDNDALKEAVMKYGAVAVMYYHEKACFNETTRAYFYNKDTYSNHGVTLVGWDDDYQVEKFRSDRRPKNPGAFLIKNSWGTSPNDDGYIWISYEDTSFCRRQEPTVFLSAESADNYGRIYQYDPCGLVTCYRMNSSCISNNWCANVFLSSCTGFIAAVGFQAPSSMSVEIGVYANCDAGDPVSGTCYVTNQAFTAECGGFVTVKLDEPVPIERVGERFSVVVHVTRSDYAYPLPVEKTLKDYCTCTATAGQSFFSANGHVWGDLRDVIGDPSANCCIKAYTKFGCDGRPAAGPATIYVDASAGPSKDADGTEEHPFASINDAVTIAYPDDTVLVRPGRYGAVSAADAASGVRILAVNGPEETFIDGEENSTCFIGAEGVLIAGFTLENGAVGGGVFGGAASNCVIRNCRSAAESSYGGGGAYGADLRECVLYGNVSTFGGGAALCTLDHCTVFGNMALIGGGVLCCDCKDSIVWGNEDDDYDTQSTFDNCCTNADPRFVSLQIPDWRLRTGSPCVGAASDGSNVGAYGGEPVEGFVISTEVTGVGTVDPPARLVSAGEDAEFAFRGNHQVAGVWTNGVPIADGAGSTNFLWESINADGILSVEFETVDYYVDAATGSDTNAGTAAAHPLRTLQKAVEHCTAGDRVIVAPGVYEGIAPKADGFSIESTHGPDVTVIDGGMANRCFNSPAYDVLLRGFTLRRGIGTGNPDYGGGAYGGMLDHCVISNCFASCGGGAAFSVMSNCLVTACRAEGGGGGLGGGACDCYLYNCTIAGNSASGYGGGAFLDEEYVAHNTIVATNVCDRGYANGHDIYGNGYWVKVCTISDQDAKFVDADGGDYHLTARSDLCIDKGGNAFVSAARDLDGNSRIAGPRVDLGCFEYVHEAEGWPVLSVEPDASAENEAAAVAEAMEDAGFDGERATLLKTAAEYGVFTSWAEDRQYEPADMVDADTPFVSVAIDADALLDSESEDIRIGDFTLSADGNWQIVLDLLGYGKPKVYASILKVAVGAKGSKDVAGDYEPLPSTVSAGSDGVVIKGKFPEKKEPCYFLKGTVR